jgi:hypothetical protein
MTEPTWNPELPWMQYDGTNGEALASAMTEANNKDTIKEEWITIFVNPNYEGSSLSLSQTWPNTEQIGQDRWRVPQGYWLNTNTGEVRNQDGVAVDWDTLVAMG